jgi:hypothetical protein
MNINWKRITKHVWRLDDRWQIVEETPGQWRCYRDNRVMLAEFTTAPHAMEEAERLRKEDALYAAQEAASE